MGFTGNLNMDKIEPQGLIRFDTAVNSALEKLDAHFEGTDADNLGIGHADKDVILFSPAGVQQASLDDEKLLLEGAVQVGEFSGTPANGMIRLNGAAVEAYIAGAWVALGGGNSVDWKDSVRVATTENITLENEQTIDGVSVVAGDRVLVKDQTNAEENGIYVCVDAGAWTRATDADASAEVTAGMSVIVTEGSTYADSFFRLTTNDAIVLGTTELAFSQLSGGGGSIDGSGAAGKLAMWSDSDTLTTSKGAKVISICSNASGARTVYTVPALKKAFVFSMWWEPTATGNIVYRVPSGGSAGTTNRILNNQAAGSPGGYALNTMLAAGDFLRIDSGGNTIAFWAGIFEYDAGSEWDTKIDFTTASITTGTQAAFYTCPALKNASFWTMNPNRGGNVMTFGGIWIHNTSGSTATISFYKTLSGGSDVLIGTLSVTAGTSNTFALPLYGMMLTAGDALKVKSSVAGCNLFGTMEEWAIPS